MTISAFLKMTRPPPPSRWRRKIKFPDPDAEATTPWRDNQATTSLTRDNAAGLHRLRFRDRFSRIEPLRAGMDAIHDRMT
jgi:hypothetical protein